MTTTDRTALLSRFIINLPATEHCGYRLFHHLEEAFWFYLDFGSKTNTTYEDTPAGFAAFACWLFQKEHLQKHVECVYRRYVLDYKYQIPTAGMAITTKIGGIPHVLMIHAKHSQKWGFPKGKRNKQEDMWACAQRECEEETGLFVPTAAVHTHIPKTKRPIIYHCHDPRPNLATHVFHPKTREEVLDVKWFPVHGPWPKNTTRITSDCQPYLKTQFSN